MFGSIVIINYSFTFNQIKKIYRGVSLFKRGLPEENSNLSNCCLVRLSWITLEVGVVTIITIQQLKFQVYYKSYLTTSPATLPSNQGQRILRIVI